MKLSKKFGRKLILHFIVLSFFSFSFSLMTACAPSGDSPKPISIPQIEIRQSAPLLQNFQIPASSGNLDLPFRAHLSGSGSKDIGAIRFDGNVGTIEIQGHELKGFVQSAYNWDQFHYVLYQIQAFDANHWQTAVVYCNDAHQIVDVFYEGMSGPLLLDENASGNCNFDDQNQSDSFELPAVSLSEVRSVLGFEIDSPDITLKSGSVGTLNRLGLDFIPYASVDCKDCGNGGWQELHSLFYDSKGTTCFGIIYLYPDQSIDIGWSFCTNDYHREFNGLLEGTK